MAIFSAMVRFFFLSLLVPATRHDELLNTRSVVSDQVLDADGVEQPTALPRPEVATMAHSLWVGRRVVGSALNLYDSFPQVFFHNRDHAADVWRFANVFAKQVGLTDEERKTLELAALLHDACHDGKMNEGSNYGPNFVQVGSHFRHLLSAADLHVDLNPYSEGYTSFARDIKAALEAETSRGNLEEATLNAVFGVTEATAENDTHSPEASASQTWFDIMVEKCPQEIVHAWVAMQFISRYDIGVSIVQIIIPILMTSMPLHSFVYSRIGDEYFTRTWENARLGHYLHMVDMAWQAQQYWIGLNKVSGNTFERFNRLEDDGHPTGAVGLSFMCRFLVEQGAYNPESFAATVSGERGFTNGLVRPYVDKVIKNIVQRTPERNREHMTSVLHPLQRSLEYHVNHILGDDNKQSFTDTLRAYISLYHGRPELVGDWPAQAAGQKRKAVLGAPAVAKGAKVVKS